MPTLRRLTALGLARAMLAGSPGAAGIAARMRACLGTDPAWIAELADRCARLPGEHWRRLTPRTLATLSLKAILHACATLGPAAQNREGRVAWAAQPNRTRLNAYSACSSGSTGAADAADQVKSLYHHRRSPATMAAELVAARTPAVANLTITRRRNALALFQAYAERALGAGTAPKGLEQSFTATLQISPSMWSQIKSSRPIGDKLARQIEQHQGKPAGWLDEAREDDTLTPAEKTFLELALKAWRATNSAGRKALREQMKQATASGTVESA